MPDPDRKKRMISLRLSDAEYNALKSQYRLYGARNVSDLARIALQNIMNASSAKQTSLFLKVGDLEERVRILETEVLFLMEEVKVLS